MLYHLHRIAQPWIPPTVTRKLFATYKIEIPGMCSERSAGEAHLYDGVSSLEQGDGQQDALLKDAVAGGVHDEVDDEVRGSLSVQVALHLGQAQPDNRRTLRREKGQDLTHRRRTQHTDKTIPDLFRLCSVRSLASWQHLSVRILLNVYGM